MGNTDKFELMANRYDTDERIHIAEKSSDAIRGYLNDTKNKNAIDFGCGTGLVGMSLLDEFQSILFLDTSPNMIKQVEHKIDTFHIKNAHTLCFDFEVKGNESLHADYIIMAQVLLHIKDFEQILSRLYNILNNEGHLLIVDFDKNDEIISDMVHPGFDQLTLSQIMSKMGYRNIQSKTFFTGSSIFMGQDASMFIMDAQK